MFPDIYLTEVAQEELLNCSLIDSLKQQEHNVWPEYYILKL